MKKLFSLSIVLLSISSIGFAASLYPMNKSAVTSHLMDKTVTTISAAILDEKVISKFY